MRNNETHITHIGDQDLLALHMQYPSRENI